MASPPAKRAFTINACAAARFPPWLWLAALITAQPLAIAEEDPQAPSESSPWAGTMQLGVGYDTNANGSTREQEFLGFTLDPEFLATESAFGEVSLGLEHTFEPVPQRGFVSTMQLAHRTNPDAPFADQTLAALGTEAVLMRGNTRWSAALSGYTSRLDAADYERGADLELAVSHSGAGRIETAFVLRASRIVYPQSDFEIQDIDRYLGGLTFKRVEIGAGSGSIGVTLLGGRDTARRADSPFGNRRLGALVSASWLVGRECSAHLEIAALHSDYPDTFFDLDRRDEQYEALVWLELENWPAARWGLTPQLRYVRNDSTVSLFAYDRIEAALYIGRQF